MQKLFEHIIQTAKVNFFVQMPDGHFDVLKRIIAASFDVDGRGLYDCLRTSFAIK